MVVEDSEISGYSDDEQFKKLLHNIHQNMANENLEEDDGEQVN